MPASQSTIEEAEESARLLKRSLAALNERIRWYRVERFYHRVTFADVAAFHDALSTLGHAWDCHSHPLYSSALARAARIYQPIGDVRAFLAGRDAWKRASLPMGVRFEITEAGRAALAASQPSAHGESTNAHSHR